MVDSGLERWKIGGMEKWVKGRLVVIIQHPVFQYSIIPFSIHHPSLRIHHSPFSE